MEKPVKPVMNHWGASAACYDAFYEDTIQYEKDLEKWKNQTKE